MQGMKDTNKIPVYSSSCSLSPAHPCFLQPSWGCNVTYMAVYAQIADFGMSRDLMDEKYYISHGGKIPVRWTAPEVISQSMYIALPFCFNFMLACSHRLSTTRSTRLPVMCGAMVWLCSRYGALEADHMETLEMKRYETIHTVQEGPSYCKTFCELASFQCTKKLSMQYGMCQFPAGLQAPS